MIAGTTPSSLPAGTASSPRPEVAALLKLFDRTLAAPYVPHGDEAQRFEADRYVVLRGLLTRPLLQVLHRYGLTRDGAGLMQADNSLPGAPAAAAYDSVMEELLHRLTPSVERLARTPLFPTYAFFRIYRAGASLPRHADRGACEISLSLNLGYDANGPWPFFVSTIKSGERAVLLEPGDALLYRGVEVEHWREPFEGQHCAQAFLHYVDQHGPYAERRFDRRDKLNRLADPPVDSNASR